MTSARRNSLSTAQEFLGFDPLPTPGKRQRKPSLKAWPSSRALGSVPQNVALQFSTHKLQIRDCKAHCSRTRSGPGEEPHSPLWVTRRSSEVTAPGKEQFLEISDLCHKNLYFGSSSGALSVYFLILFNQPLLINIATEPQDPGIWRTGNFSLKDLKNKLSDSCAHLDCCLPSHFPNGS